MKKSYWTFTFHWQLILTSMQSYRRCSLLTKDKKENCQKIRNLGKVFATSCVFYRVGGWHDLKIDLHVNLHVGFKIQFADIVPVFLEFNGASPAGSAAAGPKFCGTKSFNMRVILVPIPLTLLGTNREFGKRFFAELRKYISQQL